MPGIGDWLVYKDNTVYLSSERYQKVQRSLIHYVYTQMVVGIMASLFCALIIFIGLFNFDKDNSRLYLWAGFFVIVSLLRTILPFVYKRRRNAEKYRQTWYNLYIVGSLLGGISWGLASILLLPYVSLIQQVLIILMLAGVTAGAVPLSAAIPSSAILFLLTSLMPLVMILPFLNNTSFLLFDFALVVYLVYNIVLTMKAHLLIKNSIILQFENDVLLDNLEETNKKLKQAATHDPLTQVANRRLFGLNLTKAISSAKENKKIFALFFIDLDNFKLVNDLYGHQAGDLILLTTIDRLKNYFRKNDVIARLGGDELAIIIENMTTKREIETIAQKICQIVEMPIKSNNIKLRISASIGISVYPYDGKDEDALLRSADRCMYQAKEQGGNNFYFSKESKALV